MTALLGLLLVLVLPALAGAVLLSSTRPTDGPDPGDAAHASDASAYASDVVLARGLAAGLATWLLGSGLLTRTVGLTTGPVWVWDVVVAVASSVVLLLPRHRPRVRALLAPAVRRLGEVAGLTALVFAPLGYTILSRWWSPLGSTPWYYYGLARQVADAGAIPKASLEFGMQMPFLNDYHLFTTGTAMLLVNDAAHPMATVLTVTLLSMLLVGVGMVALASSFGVGRLASLLAVPLVVATGIAPLRSSGYRPETFGIGLGLLMVTLVVDWMRHRERGSLVGAALLAALLSQVHGIAALTSGTMALAAILVLLARGPRGQQLRNAGVALATLVVAVAVVGVTFHEASGTVHAGGLIDRGGLDDPTWEFFQAARNDPSSLPPTNAAVVTKTLGELYAQQRWWMIPVALLALYGLWRSRQRLASRQVAAFAALTLVGLAAVALVFMLGWQGYVPRRTGAQRLVLEASLVVPPLLTVGLSAGAEASWSWLRRFRLRTVRLRLSVLLGLLCACGIVSMIPVSSYDNGLAPTRAQLAVWRSLPLTSHDVVLANGYTEGFIPDISPAQGLLDGRAPYTFDSQLHAANALLRGSAQFFHDPSKNWDFLARNHVTWVVVGEGGAYSLATANVWDTPTSLQALDACPGLRQVHNEDSMAVYRVVDSGPGGC